MAGEQVHVEWGMFGASFHITIMEGEKFGPSLQISKEHDAQPSAAMEALSKEVRERHKTIVPIEEIIPALPQRGSITWTDELKGDKFMGYEIRGVGNGFRAFVQGRAGGRTTELTPDERKALLEKLLAARDLFFP